MNNFDYRELDALIHSRIRLAVMAILAATEYATFAFVKEKTGASDGNLGAHLRKLEDAGYLDVQKTFVGRTPTTQYALSERGRKAFATYVERMEDLLRPGGGSHDAP